MSNNFFSCKQFTIQQSDCAMKVSTDACLFGAWCSPKTTAISALDIGAGTGILSLMLAQNYPNLLIDAIEIEPAAYLQCTNNCQQSIFTSQIKVWNVDITNWNNKTNYDYIFSNPPYFENDLQSEKESINKAKHSTQLTLRNLFTIVNQKLNADGEFACILPIHRFTETINLAEKQSLFLNKKTLIRHNKNKPFQKILLQFSRKQIVVITDELSIYEAPNTYSVECENILSPFYLAL